MRSHPSFSVKVPVDEAVKRKYVVKGLKNIVDVTSLFGAGYALDASGRVWRWGYQMDTFKTLYTPAVLTIVK